MKRTYQNKTHLFGFVFLLVIILTGSLAFGGIKKGWKREEVDLRMSGGSKIKTLIHPQDKPVPLRKKEKKRKKVHKEALSEEAINRLESSVQQPMFANIVNSPPIDGFVPLIVASITDKRQIDDLDNVAVPSSEVLGSYPPIVDPSTDYAIGIFDTGASVHVIGNAAATDTGMFYPNTSDDLVGPYEITIEGATSSVNAWASMPLGFYIDGLGALESNGDLDDTSGMVGEWNVSIAVGQGGEPDLPTVAGSPLSVYYATEIRVDEVVSVTKDSVDYNSPSLIFYDLDDVSIPNLPNIIPLELRPLGATNVQHAVFTDPGDPYAFVPLSPSTIVGISSQSLFFLSSADLYEGEEIAYDKERFMFDTGAQITVIGNRIANRLRLNPKYPEFQVEIQDVTGDTTIANGYYIDEIQIPAFGEWLIATNVPVVLFDVASPEGGTLDGIIGMNLFTEFKLLLKGGGMNFQDDPYLAFEPINRIIADIAPEGGDGVVDNLDLEAFLAAWVSTGNTIPPSSNWNSLCDMAPNSIGDGDVNLPDYAIFAEHWYESIE
ncbi:MAG: aspartyl protease family protein [Planctomycetota bacterium]|jgi:hypothetical protein